MVESAMHDSIYLLVRASDHFWILLYSLLISPITSRVSSCKREHYHMTDGEGGRRGKGREERGTRNGVELTIAAMKQEHISK